MQEEEPFRLNDPDSLQPKLFQLHLQKDVPAVVRKCQGNCGKKLGMDNFLVVKSFGKTTWTDKKGNKKSKFGPLYMHFDRACLENFDSENFHGPSKKFDYSRIKAEEKCVSQLGDSEIQFLVDKG